MGKTLRRYLVREILVGVFAGLGLFTFILLIARLLEVVDLVMARGVPATKVASLLAYILPSFLEIAIPISLLLGVVVAFGRLSSDGEMLAMRAAGISLWQVLPPVASVGCVAAALTLLVAGWARPWALARVEQTLFDIAKTRATAALRPGMFNAVTDGVVLYAERIDDDARRLDGILLSDERKHDVRTTILAASAELAADEAAHDLFLRLNDGTSVTFHPDADNYDTTVFSSLEVHLSLKRALQHAGEVDRAPELQPTPELLAARDALRAQGKSTLEPSLEIHRRAAFAVGALLLTLIGIPLGAAPSRSVRARGLAVSVTVALAYYVLMTAFLSLARREILGPAAATWAPDLLLATAAAGMLIRLAADRPPYPTFGLRRRLATAAGASR